MPSPSAYLRRVMVSAHLSRGRMLSRRPRTTPPDTSPVTKVSRARPERAVSEVSGVGIDRTAYDDDTGGNVVRPHVEITDPAKHPGSRRASRWIQKSMQGAGHWSPIDPGLVNHQANATTPSSATEARWGLRGTTRTV